MSSEGRSQTRRVAPLLEAETGWFPLPTAGAFVRRVLRLVAAVSLLTLALVPAAAAEGTPSITVVAPAPGATITTTDQPVTITCSAPDAPGDTKSVYSVAGTVPARVGID